jgi:hypothetical protein
MNMKHKPTPEQEAIITAVAGRDSVMTSAYAGTAKSTTLEMAAPGIKVPALALAFNKKISMELELRLGGQFTVKTFNGLGHGAWARGNPKIGRLQIEPNKLGKLVGQVAKDRKVDLSSEQWDQLRRLVTAVMQAGITPGDQGKPLLKDTKENWTELANGLWIGEEELDFIYDLAREIWIKGIEMARAGIVSFDDQVYCSACLGGQFPQFPVVFVDEAQDLSPLNHHMLRQANRKDGRMVVVGDPKQAIYAFRGADSQSMERLRELRPSWNDQRLTLTFRCPKVVVERNQAHAPGFTAFHTNVEGKFTRFKSAEDGVDCTQDLGWDWAKVLAERVGDNDTLAVLCRNNGPLMSMAFKLIRQGIGPVMLGRDIGKGLVLLSRKILPEDSTPRDICAGKIEDWRVTEVSLALAKGDEGKIAGITDRAECLQAVLDGADCPDAGTLRAMLEKLFAREAGAVTLGSIHRSKGLEWDLVVHLDPWRIPSRQAREAAKAGDHGPIQQEWNLLYVAETRTKHTLINANLEDFHS